MKKCQVSSKLKILQYARACMLRSKAALHMCVFISAATHAWNTPEMCTARPTIANYRSSFLPFPTNFPRSAALADILSNVVWLAARGGLDTLLPIPATQKTAEVTGPQSCVSGVFPTSAHCSWQPAAPLSRASVLSALDPSGCEWSWTSLTPSLRLGPTRQSSPASKVNGNAVFISTAQPWLRGCPCSQRPGCRDCITYNSSLDI